MIRVVLDTNVLISGTFWSGDSFKIISLIEKGKLIFTVSYKIFKEYYKIINSNEIRQKVNHHHERAQALQKLIQFAIIIKPIEKISIVKEDPDNNKFIEAAIAGNAEFIISQDKHILKIKKYRNIKILTPDQFLSEFKD